MRLYSYWRSSASWRVRIVLAHKKIAYEYVAVDLRPDQSAQHAPEYGEVNAMRQVPVLEWTHGTDAARTMHRLTQSVAIVEYLEGIHPSPQLFPDDPLKRARVHELVEVVSSGIQPHQNTGTLAAIRKLARDNAAVTWAHDANQRGMVALERLVSSHGGRFAIGDALTMADVFLVPQLYNAARHGVDLSAFPRIVEVAARAGEPPAFVAAHPARQPDAPPEVAQEHTR